MPAENFRYNYPIVGADLVAIVGAVGTTLYRSVPRWGLILALVATAAMTVAMRSLMNWAGLISGVVGWAVAVQILALEGPTGDVLIAGDTQGYAWRLGGILALFSGLFLPATLFQERTRAPDTPPVSKE